MADVSVLNSSMRTNLLSLNNTQKLMDITQNRLSTGKKVNSALDNPTNFFAASSLNNRASDLSALVDGMTQSVQTIKAADQGIKSITSLVQQAKSQATIAAGDKASTFASRGAIDLTDIETGGAAADGKYNVTIDGVDIEVDFSTPPADEDAALAAIAAAINAEVTAAAAGDPLKGITASVVDGKLSVTADDGQAHKVEGNIAGLKLDGTADNSAVAAAEKSYNEIMAQIDDIALDSGYKGTNLLAKDDMKVVFNEDRSSTLDVNGVDASSKGLGLTRADFSTSAGIAEATTGAEGAISALRSMASDFGNAYSVVQNREDFTENLMNILTEGADKLTLADITAESANMLALQTRQQLGVQALSLASQANAAVMRLF